MHSRSQGVPLGSTPVVNHGVPVASGHSFSVSAGVPINTVPAPPHHQHSTSLGHLIKDAILGHEHKTHSQGVPIAPTPVHHVTPAAPLRVGQPVGCFPASVVHGHPVGVVPETVNHGHPVGVTPATVHTVSQGVPLSGTTHYPHH